MSDFDYFKQYQSEQARIRQKIQDEENPTHRQHLVEIDKMIDDKIRTQVPLMIQQYNDKQQVDVEAYFNVYKKSGYTFVERAMIGIEEEMSLGCIGTLSEMYDGNPPYRGRGGMSFAMNVAEILRVLKMLKKELQ